VTIEYRSFCFVISTFFLLNISSFAQSDWSIKGKLIDEQGTPLSFGLISIVHASQHNIILGFGTTDEQGRFEIMVNDSLEVALLKARYLGYELYSKEVRVDDSSYLEITMHPEENNLEEVIIRDKLPPIVIKKDTTIFNLNDFRDSSEYVIEDLLRKLPGFIISESGQIEVNGKVIERVLVEGSDMFGRKYTIGTKNIRAQHIQKVEVIDNYNDNPVMRSIAKSEVLVLNLLMDEKLKRIIIGTINSGAGYGKEVKATAHLNLFSIARKKKLILLSDNGNTGSQFGIDELRYTYGTTTGQDIKDHSLSPPGFSQTPSIATAGLPPQIVDNAKSTFSSFRYDFNLTKNWTLNGSLSHAFDTDAQTVNTSTSFGLDTSRFSLQRNSQLNISKRSFESDMNLKFVSADKNLSFNSYIFMNNQKDDGRNEVQRITNDINLNTNYDIKSTTPGLYIASNLSRKISASSALQLEMRYSKLRHNSKISLNDPLYFSFFMIDESNAEILQKWDFDMDQFQIDLRYVVKRGKLVVDIAPFYSFEKTDLLNTIQTVSEGENIFINDPTSSDETLMQSIAGLTTHFIYDITPELQFKFRNVTFGRSLNIDKSGSNANKLYTDNNVKIKYTFPSNLNAEISYSSVQRPVDLEVLFSQIYLRNNYLIYRSSPIDSLNSYQQISLNIYKQEPLKLRSYNLRVSLSLNQNSLRDSYQFFDQNLSIATPFLSEGNRAYNFFGTFDQFLPKFKTNFRISTSLSITNHMNNIENERINVNTNIYGIKLDLSTTLSRELRVKFNTNYRHLQSSPERDRALTDVTTQLFSNKLSLLLSAKSWLISLEGINRYSNSSRTSARNIITTSLKIKKDISIHKRKIRLQLAGYNLNNRSNVRFTDSNELYLIEQTIEGIAPFALFSVDMSF